MSNQFRSRSRSRTRAGQVDPEEYQNYEEIPEEFFCPISNNFMSDPVNIPNSHLTYDRDSVQHLHRRKDVVPNLRMRTRMDKWFSHYELVPAFDFVNLQYNLEVAINSVVKYRQVSVLREFTRAVKRKPWLIEQGGDIWIVATLLRCPHPSADWVATALSFVANANYDDELPLVLIGLDPKYSMLYPLTRVCKPGSERFRMGLINFMHALVMSCRDISAMEGKLGGITETLVSYVWPVHSHDSEFKFFQRLIATLERISGIEDCCQRMVDSGFVLTLFTVLSSSFSSLQRGLVLGVNVDVALVAIETGIKILDNLCSCCVQARQQIEHMAEPRDKMQVLSTALFNYVGNIEVYNAGVRVLNNFGGNRYPFNEMDSP